MKQNQELLDLLLFEPGRVRRVPITASNVGEPVRLICPTCRRVTVEDLLRRRSRQCPPAIPTVILECYRHRSGLVWTGQCDRCGLVLYNTRAAIGDDR